MKLTTLSISTTGDIDPKLLRFSESSVKIKVKSHRTFFVIFLTSAVICKQRFYLESKLHNIFKTRNAIEVTKTILESTYTLVQSS